LAVRYVQDNNVLILLERWKLFHYW